MQPSHSLSPSQLGTTSSATLQREHDEIVDGADLAIATGENEWTGTPQPSSGPPIRKRRGRAWKNGLNWTRILHVYVSMLALLVVFFFGATGVTLNHPEWTFGFDAVTTSDTGTLPDGWLAEDGTVEFLTVSEYLRDTYDTDGEVIDFGSDLGDGYISYAEPGYSADVFFDLESGDYQLSVEQQGWIGVLNELHKGRDSGSSWSVLIDVSGLFLVLIALTGLGLQLFLSKRRKAALAWAFGGAAITMVLIAVAVV